MFNVILPAHDEADFIGETLEGLLAQDASAPEEMRVIVAANGCSDRTAEIAHRFAAPFATRGWELIVLDIPEGGKPGALNRADAEAGPGPRAYLDADVVCSPTLVGLLARALDEAEPRYASGIFTITPPKSLISRLYARLWLKVPFMTTGVPGCGLFAVNEAGRARWQDFPDIIADDLFVRLNFAPSERIRVDAPFTWVLAEGFGALVRVRRRWDTGNRQLLELRPDLAVNEEKAPVRPADHLRLLAGQPLSYLVYVAVAVASRFSVYDRASWARGR